MTLKRFASLLLACGFTGFWLGWALYPIGGIDSIYLLALLGFLVGPILYVLKGHGMYFAIPVCCAGVLACIAVQVSGAFGLPLENWMVIPIDVAGIAIGLALAWRT